MPALVRSEMTNEATSPEEPPRTAVRTLWTTFFNRERISKYVILSTVVFFFVFFTPQRTGGEARATQPSPNLEDPGTLRTA